MKYTLLWILLAVLLLALILFFPLLISVDFYVDEKEKCGFYLVRVCGVRIFCGRALLKGTKLEFENERDWLKHDTQLTKKLALFGYILYRFIEIVSVKIVFEAGEKENQMLGALVCGSVISTLSTLFAFFKTKNPDATFSKQVKYAVSSDKLNCYVKFNAAVSLFEILLSFILMRIELSKSVQTKKEVKE